MNFNVTYNEKDIVEGIVIKIKQYGVFFSFDSGYAGLLHISDISDKFVSNINSLFKIGEKYTLLIKSIDRNKKFMSLSMRELPDGYNHFNDLPPSKKANNYRNEINFQDLENQLPNMIKEELEREKL